MRLLRELKSFEERKFQDGLTLAVFDFDVG